MKKQRKSEIVHQICAPYFGTRVEERAGEKRTGGGTLLYSTLLYCTCLSGCLSICLSVCMSVSLSVCFKTC